MSLTEDQRKKLNQNLDPRWVKSRTQGGGSVSYVEGWYVIDRLNEIVGSGSWSYDIPDPRLVVDEEREAAGKGKRWHVTYTARCVLRVGDATICDWGTGHGIDRDRGASHESAIKEACTDALKRAAKSLGRSMGLALYDKEQEHVAANAAEESEIGSVLALMAEARSPSDLDKAREAWKRIAPNATDGQRERIKVAGMAAKKRMEAAS